MCCSGIQAGKTDQGLRSIAIGGGAGRLGQNSYCIGIGYDAGEIGQYENSIAIGINAGRDNQQRRSLAVGNQAARFYQGEQAVALGSLAGFTGQNSYGVAIGTDSGYTAQRTKAVSIGFRAGYNNQGESSIALGAHAGNQDQPDNTIIINATGTTFTGSNTSAFYVKPVREVSYSANILAYHTGDGEVCVANQLTTGGDITANAFFDYTGAMMGSSPNFQEVTDTGNVTTTGIQLPDIAFTGNVTITSTTNSIRIGKGEQPPSEGTAVGHEACKWIKCGCNLCWIQVWFRRPRSIRHFYRKLGWRTPTG